MGSYSVGCGEPAQSPSNPNYYFLHGLFQCKPKDMTPFPPKSLQMIFNPEFRVSPGTPEPLLFLSHDKKEMESNRHLTVPMDDHQILQNLNDTIIEGPITALQQIASNMDPDFYRKLAVCKKVLHGVASSENIPTIIEQALYMGTEVSKRLDRVTVVAYNFGEVSRIHKPVTELWANFKKTPYIRKHASQEGSILYYSLANREANDWSKMRGEQQKQQSDLMKIKREQALRALKKKTERN